MLKSIFIALYVVYLTVGAFLTIQGFSSENAAVAWWAAMLGHFFPIGWFIYIYTIKLVNHNFVSLLVTIASGVCALIATAQFYVIGDVSSTPANLAWIAFTGWLCYNFIYARQRQSSNFEIGQTFNASALGIHEAKTPYCLFVFHRGNWCPFSVEQMKDYTSRLNELNEAQVGVVSISMQTSEKQDKLVSHLGDNVQIQIPGVTEELIAFAKDNGIYRSHALPLGLDIFGFGRHHFLPVSVLVDDKNKIIATHQSSDYRNRPSLDYFLRYLSQYRNP